GRGGGRVEGGGGGRARAGSGGDLEASGERYPPFDDGAPAPLCPARSEAAAEILCSLLHMAQAACLVDTIGKADSVVFDTEKKIGARLHQHLDLGGVRVLSGVRQGFLERRQQMLSDLTRHDDVDRAIELQLG